MKLGLHGYRTIEKDGYGCHDCRHCRAYPAGCFCMHPDNMTADKIYTCGANRICDLFSPSVPAVFHSDRRPSQRGAANYADEQYDGREEDE